MYNCYSYYEHKASIINIYLAFLPNLFENYFVILLIFFFFHLCLSRLRCIQHKRCQKTCDFACKICNMC